MLADEEKKLVRRMRRQGKTMAEIKAKMKYNKKSKKRTSKKKKKKGKINLVGLVKPVKKY